MSRPRLLTVVCLLLKIITTSTSVSTTLKSIDSATTTSAKVHSAASMGASTSSLTSSQHADPKPVTETSSKVTSSANTTASKPSSNVVASIPTFDFSFVKEQKPAPKIVNTCNTKDMCMQGFCIKGTCKTKKCSTDVFCLCDPGYTGQLCDKNITEVELKNGRNGKHGKSTGKAETKTATAKKELVNGNINRKLLTENGNGENGNHDNGNNGDIGKTVKSNGSDNGAESQKKINGDKGHSYKENSNGGEASKGNENGKHKAVKDKIISTPNVDNGFLEKTVRDKTSGMKPGKVLSDGSYVKGPEVYVPSDNSAIVLNTSKKEIDKGTPTVVKERTEIVTISTVAVSKTRLGIAPEMLTSVKRSKSYPKAKAISNSETKSSKQTEKARKSRNKDFTSSKRTIKEKSHILSPSEKKSSRNVVSSVDILNDKRAVVTEESGVVSIRNNTFAANPLFANSEIKITIEASQIDSLIDQNNTTRASTNSKPQKESSVVADKINEISKNSVAKNAKNGGKQTEKVVKERTTNKDKKSNVLKSVKNKDVVDITSQIALSSSGQSPKKDVGASQNTDSRKSMKSDILNPLIELMNIIGSDKFAEKVSAVKIEIYTKQNGTDTRDTNKQKTKTGSSEIKAKPKGESKVSSKETVPATNVDSQNRGPT